MFAVITQFSKRHQEILVALLGGFSLALAFGAESDLSSALFGWVAACSLVSIYSSLERPFVSSFSFGFSFYSLVWCWVPRAAQYYFEFSGFEHWGLLAVCILFSSAQFYLVAVVIRGLRVLLSTRSSLLVLISWGLVELIYPKLFPWTLAGTQLGFLPLSHLASYVGLLPLSLLMLWAAQKLLSYDRRAVIELALAACLISFSYFAYQAQLGAMGKSRSSFKVALIQPGKSKFEMKSRESEQMSKTRLRALSAQAVEEGAEVIVWPESSIAGWTGEMITDFSDRSSDPLPGVQTPLIFGAQTFRYGKTSRNKYFNSLIAVDASRKRIGLYHKQKLMPFSEAIPFVPDSEAIKWSFKNTAGYSNGTSSPVVSIPVGQKDISFGTFICYEDLFASQGREAVALGAEILLSILRDSWLLSERADRQHERLSRWRAVETGRYLLRATADSSTAVFDPLGRRQQSIKPGAVGALTLTVPRMSFSTLYVQYGNLAFFLIISTMLLALLPGRAFLKVFTDSSEAENVAGVSNREIALRS